MKKGLAFIIFFGISCCFLFLPALSIAESETNVSVGLKTWYTGWKSKEAGGVPSEEAVFLVGPSIKFSKDKLFGGITYVTSTKDFEFKRPTRTDTRSRNDIDAIIGYMIHQRVGLFTGLKYVFGETKEVEPGQPDSSSKYRLYGMAYGATINYPVPDTPMVLVANYSYVPTKFRSKNERAGRYSVDKGSFAITAYEGTAIYALSRSFSANIGYKHQVLTTETFSGFTFGVDYRF